MQEEKTKIVRVSKKSYEDLRFLSFKQNKSMTKIIDELLDGKVDMTIVEKLLRMRS